MIKSYFEELCSQLEQELDTQRDGPRARKLGAHAIARFGVDLFSGRGRVAWCGVLAPFELLTAMGVTPCFTEFVAAVLGASGAAVPMLTAAENYGYSTDSCSFHRTVLGAALMGKMPSPEFLVAASMPCTGGMVLLDTLARHFGRDLFTLHVPTFPGARAEAYVAHQLRDLVKFVERKTGTTLDPVRLRTAIERSNAARALMQEALDLAQGRPSPARRQDLNNMGLSMVLLSGREAGVDVARAFRDEFTATVASGRAHRGKGVRLMWLQSRVQFTNALEVLLEDTLSAAVVADEFKDVYWEPLDPDEPFRSMARRALSFPLCGPIEQRVGRIRRRVAALGIHGVINPCHWGCRNGTGARGLIDESLRAHGIPVLHLEVDCGDPRRFSEAQLRTRIEAFVEMLEVRIA